MKTKKYSNYQQQHHSLEMLTASGKKVDDTLVYALLLAVIVLVGTICYAMLLY